MLSSSKEKCIYDAGENEVSGLTFRDQPQNRKWSATYLMFLGNFFGIFGMHKESNSYVIKRLV